MLDLRSIRENPERLREVIRLRRVDPARADVDRWLQLDAQRRRLQGQLDEANAEKKQLAALGRSDPDAARRQGQELRERTRGLEEELALVSAAWQAIMEWFPNWPHPKMPEGAGEEDNVEECVWSPAQATSTPPCSAWGPTPPRLMPRRPPHAGPGDFTPLTHAELGPRVGIDTAARGQGLRLALRLPHRATWPGCSWPSRTCSPTRLLGAGYTPLVPAPAGARAGAVRDVALPRGARPGVRDQDRLRRGAAAAVPGRVVRAEQLQLLHGPHPEGGGAAASASSPPRPASAPRPAPGARTCGGSSACTSSTRSR